MERQMKLKNLVHLWNTGTETILVFHKRIPPCKTNAKMPTHIQLFIKLVSCFGIVFVITF